jgi:Tol biopolymer transport system component
VKIWIVDWPSQEVMPLHEFSGCQENSSWSPVSNEIAYQGNPDDDWDIFVEAPANMSFQNLTTSANVNEYQPDWSPDGHHIVYVAVQSLPTSKAFSQELYIIDLASRETTQLTNTPDEHESFPRWSPDGSRIAFFVEKDGA